MRGYLGCPLRGREMGAREILLWEELECWGQPWVHGRAWDAGDHPGVQPEPGVHGAPQGAGKSLRWRGAPQGTGFPVPAAWESQGTPTPHRQLAFLSFPGSSQAPSDARVTPSSACRAQFHHQRNRHPRAQLCWSSPRAGCAPSQAGRALPPALGIIPDPRDGGVGLG